jgi:hypothetical protein
LDFIDARVEETYFLMPCIILTPLRQYDSE